MRTSCVLSLPNIVEKILLHSLIGEVLLLCVLASEEHIFFYIHDPQSSMYVKISEVPAPSCD